jgi:tetratricopeptide (TPR) repeat protein
MSSRGRSLESPNRLTAMRPAMNIHALSLVRVRALVFTAVGIILLWLVLSRSLAAFLADTAPQAALWFDSRKPEALVNLADRALVARSDSALGDAPSQDSEDASAGSQNVSGKISKYLQNLTHAFSRFETIGRNLNVSRPVAPDNEPAVRMRAQTAVTNDPLNVRALRILGQLAEADSDDEDATKFMHAADDLSLHENYASYWLMRRSATTGDYKSAIYYADVLLRTNPQSSAYVVPVLAQISEDKAGATLVKALLTDNPPWRRQFISMLPNSVTDARTPLDLLLALRDSPVPPSTEEIGPYLDFLIARKFYGLAYYTWLQFLPSQELGRAGLLYNGSFEVTPSGLPFDWKITPGAGVTVDIVSPPDELGRHALLIDFQYGRVEYHSVSELVMLTPGSYEFKGEYKGKLAGPRGMKWRIVCANGTLTSGGESPMIAGVAKDWSNIGFTFTVPDKDCPAQYVRLDLDARMVSEQLISGSILFDDVQILRVTSQSTAGDKPE